MKKDTVLLILCQQSAVCLCSKKEAEEYTEFERLADIKEPYDQKRERALRAKLLSQQLPMQVYFITGDLA